MLPEHPNLDKDYYRESELSYLTDAIEACVFAEMEGKKLNWVRSQRAQIELVQADVKSMRIGLFFTKSQSRIGRFMNELDEKIRSSAEKKITSQIRRRKNPAEYLRKLTISQIERGRKYRELALREQIKNEEFNRTEQMPKNRLQKLMLALFGPRSRYPRETGSLLVGGSSIASAGALAYLHGKHKEGLLDEMFPFGREGSVNGKGSSNNEGISRDQIFGANPTNSLGTESAAAAAARLEPAAGNKAAAQTNEYDQVSARATNTAIMAVALNHASNASDAAMVQDFAAASTEAVAAKSNGSRFNPLAQIFPSFFNKTDNNDNADGSATGGTASGGATGGATGGAASGGNQSGNNANGSTEGGSASGSGNTANNGGSNNGSASGGNNGNIASGGSGNANSGSNSTNAVVAGNTNAGAVKGPEGVVPVTANPGQTAAQVAATQNQKAELINSVNVAQTAAQNAAIAHQQPVQPGQNAAQAVAGQQAAANAAQVAATNPAVNPAAAAVNANSPANPAANTPAGTNIAATNNSAVANAQNAAVAPANAATVNATGAQPAAATQTANVAQNTAATPAGQQAAPTNAAASTSQQVAQTAAPKEATPANTAPAAATQQVAQTAAPKTEVAAAPAPKVEQAAPAPKAEVKQDAGNLASNVVKADFSKPVEAAPKVEAPAASPKISNDNAISQPAPVKDAAVANTTPAITPAVTPASPAANQTPAATSQPAQPAEPQLKVAATTPAATNPAAPAEKVVPATGEQPALKVAAAPEGAKGSKLPDSLKNMTPETLGQVAATGAESGIKGTGANIPDGTAVPPPAAVNPAAIAPAGPIMS